MTYNTPASTPATVAAAPSSAVCHLIRLIEHDAYDSDAEGDSAGGGASDDCTATDTQQQVEGTAKSRGGPGKLSALDPETVFMQEVGETFLRCVKERFAETNAVIELNGLKIAEDRTFADCARYIFTALLQVIGPLGVWCCMTFGRVRGRHKC